MEMRWIETEIRNYPTYDGTSYLNNFLTDIDIKFVPDQRISVFYIALKDTSARWWATHKKLLLDWEDAKRAIRWIFLSSDQLKKDMNMDFQGTQLFDGKSDPRVHVEHFLKQWKVAEVPPWIWVHLLFHSLGEIQKSWYIHEEIIRQTSYWKTLKDQFCRDFYFTDKSPKLQLVLQRIWEMLFYNGCKTTSSPVVCSDHFHFIHSNWGHNPIRISLACCKIDKGLKESNEVEELRKLNIKEMVGTG